MTKGLQRTAKTASRRQLQDKSYWIGEIRSKMTEIKKEVEKLGKKETIQRQEDESYNLYEKRAENAAKDISELTEKLTEKNLILEKLSISATIDDMQKFFIFKVSRKGAF